MGSLDLDHPRAVREPEPEPEPAPHGAAVPPPTSTGGAAGGRLAIAAIGSAAAALLHGAAAGIHADTPGLARLFVVLATLQAAAAVVAFVRDDRVGAASLVGVNLVAVAGWIVTRISGIEWIGGLEVAERPQLADSVAAAFATVAVIGTVAAWRPGTHPAPRSAVSNSAVLALVLLVPAMLDTTGHDHGTVDGHDHTAGSTTATAAAADGTAATDGHSHGDTPTTATDSGSGSGSGISSGGDIDGALGALLDEQGVTDHAHTWPRPFDPAQPVDLSGVDGVTAEQQARAEQLIVDTLRELPAFADVGSIGDLGYRSIGDESTGFEHFVNYGLIADDVMLDPTQPESLVYRVDGSDRTLVSAMFIAGNRPIDDPELVDFGGPLMQWHVHDNLCWGLDENNRPVVVDVLEAPGDACPPASVNAGAENPMVHVWIAPHECGPFAALEGHGAGQVDPATGARTDQCAHDHGGATGTGSGAGGAATTTPYDPAKPIDLGGTPGVSAEQQAFAENLVAATVRDLPQWSDLEAVEAAGFRSIGDAATGHEHYIQWEWIDDDVILDPDRPESLVFRQRPDGTKELVSAMYMLPSEYALDEVPDWGGDLMQWHVHGDLCFTDDPVSPRVTGTKPLGGTCNPPSVDGTEAPMIHVWIVPNECGPFAALEGIAGGQVPDGEAVLCDHAHGSG